MVVLFIPVLNSKNLGLFQIKANTVIGIIKCKALILARCLKCGEQTTRYLETKLIFKGYLNGVFSVHMCNVYSSHLFPEIILTRLNTFRLPNREMKL